MKFQWKFWEYFKKILEWRVPTISIIVKYHMNNHCVSVSTDLFSENDEGIRPFKKFNMEILEWNVPRIAMIPKQHINNPLL